MALEETEALEDVFLRLGAEAGQVEQAVLMAGALQLAERCDAQLIVEHLHLLGAQTGHAQQVEQAVGK